MKKLIWHDEKDCSWTYCGRFLIQNIVGPFWLWRANNPNINTWSDGHWIGHFKTLSRAKRVAEMINRG